MMSERAVRREAQQTLEQHAKVVKKEFEAIVKDWSDENRPSFTTEIHKSDRELRIIVRPYKRRKSSKIFGYVDKGTKPHVIKAKSSNKSGRLAFNLYSQPITQPVAQYGLNPKGPKGPLVRPQQVNHPGSKARLFSETVQKKTAPLLKRDIENMFRRLERKINKR
jgi:hypothetical protein